MPLHLFHHKKEDRQDNLRPRSSNSTNSTPTVPELRFTRSDSNSETQLQPSNYGEGEPSANRHRSSSTSQRIRNSFHLHRHREPENSPVGDLPPPPPPVTGGPAESNTEAAWEARATELARIGVPQAARSRSASVSATFDDDSIQEAIRLHEGQRYAEATAMFKKLADSDTNNTLAQILYALSLRHGWGCQTDEARAAEYLQRAANNAADIEQDALAAGFKSGGAAKGELVLAIYELANCYRQGWGVPKDAQRAFQYYLTAANLGDVDAMNEVGLCYLNGFGTKKNKYESARYYRLAESKGSKTVGNSWIYKPKYTNPPKS